MAYRALCMAGALAAVGCTQAAPAMDASPQDEPAEVGDLAPDEADGTLPPDLPFNCTEGETLCSQDSVYLCIHASGEYSLVEDCGADEVCLDGQCCKPDCEMQICGDDGCGGSCGQCPEGWMCSGGGMCVCDDWGELCGGLCCPGGDVCVDGACCSPDCSDSECGDDGCGGDCGSCLEGEVCMEGNCCSTSCGFIECGTNECGQSCGQCPEGQACQFGLCSDGSCKLGFPSHVGGPDASVVDVGFSQNIACALERGGKLVLLDTAGPMPMVPVGAYPGGDAGKSVVTAGDLALLSVANSGVHLVNIEDPKQPELKAIWSEGMAAPDPAGNSWEWTGFDVQEGLAFGVTPAGQFQVLDVSFPESPSLLGTLSAPFACPYGDLDVAGGTALVSIGATEAEGGVGWLVDVTDPSSPVSIGTYDEWPASDCVGILAMDLAGPLAALSVGYGTIPQGLDQEVSFWSDIHVLDLSTPAEPVVLTKMWSELAIDVRLKDENMFILENRISQGGMGMIPSFHGVLAKYGMSLPAEPVALSSIKGLGGYWGGRLDVAGKLAAVAMGSEGLGLVDVEAGEHFGRFREPDYAGKLLADDSLLFVAGGLSGFFILDVQDPDLPVQLGWYDGSGTDEFVDVHVEDGYAYLANRLAGPMLTVLDVSVPSKLDVVAEVKSDAMPFSVDGRDGYLYLASWDGLEVYDVSAPQLPILMDVLPMASDPNALSLEEDHLYAGTDKNVQIFDVSAPEAPTPAGAVALELAAFGIDVASGFAYVACQTGNPLDKPTLSALVVVDVANAEAPKLVGSVPLPGRAYDVVVRDDRAFVACGEAGMRVVDVSDPVAPKVKAAFTAEGIFAGGVALTPTAIWLGGGDEGLFGLDTAGCK